MQAFRKLYIDEIRQFIDKLCPNVDEICQFFGMIPDESKNQISAAGGELIFVSSSDGF